MAETDPVDQAVLMRARAPAALRIVCLSRNITLAGLVNNQEIAVDSARMGFLALSSL